MHPAARPSQRRADRLRAAIALARRPADLGGSRDVAGAIMGDTDRDDLRVRRCVGLRVAGPGLALATGMMLLSTSCPRELRPTALGPTIVMANWCSMSFPPSGFGPGCWYGDQAWPAQARY